MKRTLPLLLLFACILSLLAAGACSSGKSPAEAELWTCPMHPTYVADHPGTCPICNMDLVKKEKGATEEKRRRPVDRPRPPRGSTPIRRRCGGPAW